MYQQAEVFYQNLAMPEGLTTLLVSTLFFVLSIIILRTAVVRFIHRSIASVELRRRWLVQSRNAILLLLLLGLILIWGEALRTLALSIVAIAVAFVVATKELIMCVTGSMLKSGAQSFNIGDRIQVKDFRGDVIDQNMLATTILEVGPGKTTHQRTGRMTVIPNSLFVSEPVINESYTNDYVLHVFTVPFKRSDNWQKAQQDLLDSAKRHCGSYLEDVRKYMKKITDRQGLDAPSVDPRVSIYVPDADEIHMVVRIPAKSSQRVQVEQAILSDVLANDYGE